MGRYMIFEEKHPENENSEEITMNEFLLLVKDMRHQQRRYERFGKMQIKETKERAEQKVDEALGKIFNTQMKLF